MNYPFICPTCQVLRDDLLSDVLVRMHGSVPKLTCAFVVNETGLEGVFTEQDLWALVAEGRSLHDLAIGEVMTASITSLHVSELDNRASLLHALQQSPHPIAVLDHQNTLVGAITPASVYPYLIEKLQVQDAIADDLRKSEAKHLSLIRALPDLIVRMSGEGIYLDRWIFGQFNSYAHNDDVIGQSLMDVLPEEIAEMRLTYMQRALQTEELQIYEQQIMVDGVLRTEEVRITVCGENEVLVIVRDISDRKQVEASLRMSEATNRAIIQVMPDLLMRVDRQGNCLQLLNRGSVKKVLLPTGESIPFDLAEILPQPLLEQRQATIRCALETGESQRYDQCLELDGEICWEEVCISPISADEVLVMVRDVTDRKQAEIQLQQLNQELEDRVAQRTADLQASEERWQLALQGSDASLWDWNLLTHKIFRTQRWRQLRGLSQEEVGTNPAEWVERIHPEDRDRVLAAFNDHLARKTPFYAAEYRVRQRDGQYLWILDRGQAQWDENGTPVRIIGSEMDIDRRKQAEEELRKNTVHLSSAQRIARLGSWEFHIDTQAIRWSEETYRIFDRALQDGPPTLEEFSNYICESDRPMVQAALDLVINHNQPFEAEYRICHADGTLKYVLSRGELVYGESGRPPVLVGTVLDISARKLAELQLQRTNEELDRATRLKDEFLANMSHELRTPLNAILGMSEGLGEGIFGPINDRQQKAIATIERSGRHLLELINDILDLSKIEAGKLEIDAAPVSVDYLCESSLTFVRQQAVTKGIDLTMRELSPMPDIVVDERRIRQALINLLTNAIKFTPTGGRVELSVSYGENPNGRTLELSVIDTGIGIAQADLCKLFEPFVQIDSRLNRQHEGTGLGLALVKQLVELHGGQVSVTSQVGQGSCFTISLPYLTEASSILPEPVPYRPTSLNAEHSSALIIEDSIVAAEQISRYLDEQGITAVVHPCGEGAIAKVIELQPSFIILDILLPNASGWEVLQQLKTNPQTSHIPVIIVSVVDERAYGLSLGATDYLVKPISRQQLQQAIARIFPVQPQAETAALVITIPDSATPTPTAPLILLAEDNDINVFTIANYLEAFGYQLIFAKTGREVLDLLVSHRPDLIIMDIQMPEMDGLQATRLIRQTADFANLPIIALTALAMPGDREKCLEAGATEYLTKPVRLKHLKAVIQDMLQ